MSDAASHAAESAAGAEEALVDETTTGADEQPGVEATEEPIEGEEGEGEGEQPAPPPAEPDELTLLRQRVSDLEPLAQIAQRMLADRDQQPAPQAPSRDPRGEAMVRQAIRTLAEKGAGKEFDAFAPDVRFEAGRRVREMEEENILRLTDPDAWAEKVVAPVVRKFVAPVAAKFAQREFLLQNPDLGTPEDIQAITDLYRAQVPIQAAAEIVRLRKAVAPGAKQAADERARRADAEALKQARRGRAAPPRTTTRAAPKSLGWKAEDVLAGLEESGHVDEE